MSNLYQVGVLSAFLNGIYEGTHSFSHLKQKGNIGLGILNNLQGEMVAVDGKFYRICEHGEAKEVKDSDKTPFALVCPFREHQHITLKNIANIDTLNQALRPHLISENIFHMIRINAHFKHISLRSECLKYPSCEPLGELLPKIQKGFELSNHKGTLVATFCPLYSMALTIPGFHYHFIDAQRAIGGHAFDFEIESATISLQPLHDFEISLTDSDAFNKISCDVDVMHELKKIE
jgi:acetolactate decarboxylase